MQNARVLGLILAGGKGTRLFPLTKERTKPAVPFGGKYRIVDFVLSNFINSGIYSVYVLTQFKSQSLLQHLRNAWQFSELLTSQFIIPVPAQMRKGEKWYQGTSDAIYQNIHLIELSQPEMVAVFGADHIYYMDIRADDRLPPGQGRQGHRRGPADPGLGGRPVRHGGSGLRLADRPLPGEGLQASRDSRQARMVPRLDGKLHVRTRTCSWPSCAGTRPSRTATTTSAETCCPKW